MKRIHKKKDCSVPTVVYDPHGDFAGPLPCFKQTLALGYFTPGMVVAKNGKRYVVTGKWCTRQRLKAL